MIHPYIIHLLVMAGVYVMLAASLNLALGYAGILNLGHVAFFGVGAYTSALLTKAGVPFIISFPTAGLLAALIGYILTYATRRLRGEYLALATLGFGFVFYSLMLNWTSLTRGPLGVAGITRPALIASNTSFLLFVAATASLSLIILHRLTSSPFGRLLGALRDDEIGLRVLGKDAFKLKSKAMMVSAFFAGVSGSLYAHYITYIDPNFFTLNEVTLLLTIVVVGGLASLKGSVVATFIIILVPETLRLLSLPAGVLGPVRNIAYALTLLLMLYSRPRGLCGRISL